MNRMFSSLFAGPGGKIGQTRSEIVLRRIVCKAIRVYAEHDDDEYDYDGSLWMLNCIGYMYCTNV